MFKQNSPLKKNTFFVVIKKKAFRFVVFLRTLIKSTPARFESRARACRKERSHHVSNGTFFDWSLSFLSRPAMRFSRTPRGFEISAGFAGFDFRSTSPLTHLSFFSNLQCTKRMMRANAGRHHGETVGLFSRDLSHVWMIDCSGSFSTSLSFIVRAFDLLEKKHTKTLEEFSFSLLV